MKEERKIDTEVDRLIRKLMDILTQEHPETLHLAIAAVFTICLKACINQKEENENKIPQIDWVLLRYMETIRRATATLNNVTVDMNNKDTASLVALMKGE